jgi:hypothetical protein
MSAIEEEESDHIAAVDDVVGDDRKTLSRLNITLQTEIQVQQSQMKCRPKHAAGYHSHGFY